MEMCTHTYTRIERVGFGGYGGTTRSRGCKFCLSETAAADDVWLTFSSRNLGDFIFLSEMNSCPRPPRLQLWGFEEEVFPRVFLLHIFVEFLSFCESGFCFPCINLSWNKPHNFVRVLGLERQVNPRKPIDQEHLFSYLRVSNPKEGC